MSRGSLGAAALEYACRGWPVFPLRRRGKEPLWTGGFKLATTETEQVRRWWREDPEANIGFPPGRAGIVVLDYDSDDGRRLAVKLGLFSEPTLMVETPRGAHLYFQHPGGRIGNRKLEGVLDVRADAGYVLLPPSIHPTGATYRALGTMDQIRPLPPKALEALQASAPKPPKAASPSPIEAGTPRRRAYVVAAIESECLELASTPEGGRNHRLNAAAFSLARFAETGEADPGKLADLLTFAARNAGLSEHEIQRTIASAYRARGVEPCLS